MKIKKIERDINNKNNYIVEFENNWFKKLINNKTNHKTYIDSGRKYKFGCGSEYISTDGVVLGNFNEIGMAIDEWRKINNDSIDI